MVAKRFVRSGDISRASIDEAQELRFQGIAARRAKRRRVQPMSADVTGRQRSEARRNGPYSPCVWMKGGKVRVTSGWKVLTNT